MAIDSSMITYFMSILNAKSRVLKAINYMGKIIILRSQNFCSSFSKIDLMNEG